MGPAVDDADAVEPLDPASSRSYPLRVAYSMRAFGSLLPVAALLAGCGARVDLASEPDSASAVMAGAGGDEGAAATPDARAEDAGAEGVTRDAAASTPPDGPVVETVCDVLAQCCPTLAASQQASCATMVGDVDGCDKALDQFREAGYCTSVPAAPLAASCQALDLCCLSVPDEKIAACGATVVANDGAACSAAFDSMSVCAGYAAPNPTACLTLGGCCTAPWLSAADAAACSALAFAGVESACTPVIQTYCAVG